MTSCPSTSLSHVVKYVYTSSRLTEIDALDYPATGTNAAEAFAYNSSTHYLENVCFPNYDANNNTDPQASISYGSSPADNATVTRYGRVNDTPHTAVTQTFK